MTVSTIYDRPVNDKAAKLAARAARCHEELTVLRARVQRIQTKRNEMMLAAWHEGAEMAELAHALGMSTQAVSKAIGRPTGRTWHVAGTGKAREVVADGD